MPDALQRLEGRARKAMQMYQMIEAGDRVCVGVSGGKDSVSLTLALHRLQKYYELPFTVQALTIDPCFFGQPTDYSALSDFFAAEGIPHTIESSNIGRVVFELRQEQNPCALCSNLRRGALNSGAKRLGCNVVALGHHQDDVVETFFMNLFVEGRIACFSPVTWLSRSEVTVIRPLVLAREYETERVAQELALPIVKSFCPADGFTGRAVAKSFVLRHTADDPAFCQKIFGAMQKAGIDGWAPRGEASHRRRGKQPKKEPGAGKGNTGTLFPGQLDGNAAP